LRRFAFSGSAKQRVQPQPLPLLPDLVARLTYKEFLGLPNGTTTSPESGLYKILDAVATQGSRNLHHRTSTSTIVPQNCLSQPNPRAACHFHSYSYTHHV
jgi:hypothetical protein